MKRIIIASILAAAALAPANALAGDFIAKRIQDNESIGFTRLPCDDEPGHKVLIAKGNWLGSGCYMIMHDGAASIRWYWKKDPLDAYDRIEARDITTIKGEFNGWPSVDWSKQKPLSPNGNRG